MKKPSKQRRFQLRRVKAGLCSICSKPLSDSPQKDRCNTCVKRKRKADEKRLGRKMRCYPPKTAWAAVDWSKSIQEIAASMGVTYQATMMQYKKRHQ